MTVLVDHQKLWTAKASLAVRQSAESSNGKRRQKYLRATFRDIDHKRTSVVFLDEIFDSKICEVYRALQRENRDKEVTEKEDRQPRTDALYRNLDDVVMFHKIMKRFADRAKRFKLPEGAWDGECVDEEGFAELVAMLAQRDAAQEAALHSLSSQAREQVRHDAGQSQWRNLLSALQKKNENIAKSFVEFSQLSRAHHRHELTFRADEEQSAPLSGILYRDEHGTRLNFLLRAVTKSGFAAQEEELEAALLTVKMTQKMESFEDSISVDHLEFRQILSLLALTHCNLACWPGTAYVREFCHDESGCEIPDARRSASCAASRFSGLLDRILLPSAAESLPKGALGVLKQLLVERSRQEFAFYEASSIVQGCAQVSHSRKKERTKASADKAEPTSLEFAVLKSGYRISADDLDRLVIEVKRSSNLEEESLIWLNVVEFRRLLKTCGSKSETTDEGVIMFDDVMDIARHFHDSYSHVRDYQVLRNFQKKGRRLKRELKALFLRCIVFLVVFISMMCFFLLAFVVDTYLIAQSWFGPQVLVDKMREYKKIIADATPHLRIPLSLSFDVMALLAIDFNIKGGVSCTGMQAPVYLALNYVVVGMIVVLFDTAIFQVLRVAAEDYNHPRPFLLHRASILKVSVFNALKIEEEAIRGIIDNLSRNVRTICQILIAKTDFWTFVPYWGEISDACEAQYPGSERVAQYGASIAFWVLFPACFHLLLHSFCYGVGPPDIDPEYRKAVRGAKRCVRGRISKAGPEDLKAALESCEEEQKEEKGPSNTNSEEALEEGASSDEKIQQQSSTTTASESRYLKNEAQKLQEEERKKRRELEEAHRVDHESKKRALLDRLKKKRTQKTNAATGLETPLSSEEISTIVQELNENDMQELLELQKSMQADEANDTSKVAGDMDFSDELRQIVEEHAKHRTSLEEAIEEKRKSSSDALKQRLAEKRAQQDEQSSNAQRASLRRLDSRREGTALRRLDSTRVDVDTKPNGDVKVRDTQRASLRRLDSRREGTALHRLDSTRTKREVSNDIIIEGTLNRYNLSNDTDKIMRRRLMMAIRSSNRAKVRAIWRGVSTTTIPNSYIGKSYDEDEENKTEKSRFFSKLCGFRWCSLASLFCKGWVNKETRTMGETNSAGRDLFVHSPEFWQIPQRWWGYLMQLSRENARCFPRIKAVGKYLRIMRWKFFLLVRMTSGVWNSTLLENMEVAIRSERLDITNGEGSNYENVLASIGMYNSIVWQFIPFAVFLSKAGESLNESLIFVSDRKVKDALYDAGCGRDFEDFERPGWLVCTRNGPGRHFVERNEGVGLSLTSGVAMEWKSTEEAEKTVPGNNRPTPEASSWWKLKLNIPEFYAKDGSGRKSRGGMLVWIEKGPRTPTLGWRRIWCGVWRRRTDAHIMFVEDKEPGPNCPEEHGLRKLKAPRESSIVCDICASPMGAEAALACQKCDYWTCAGCSGSIAVEEGFTKVTPEEQYRADLEHRRSYEYKGTSKLTRGSLPSKSKPMFIRGFNCCVKVHCSTDDPSFRLCAVPIHEEPVFFKKSLARRSLRWCCYVAQFTAKIMFCFFSYELAVRAVLIYLLVSAALALEGASEKTKMFSEENDRQHLFDLEAWADLLVSTCYRCVANRHDNPVIPRSKKRIRSSTTLTNTSPRGARSPVFRTVVPVINSTAPYSSRSKALSTPPVKLANQSSEETREVTEKSAKLDETRSAAATVSEGEGRPQTNAQVQRFEDSFKGVHRHLHLYAQRAHTRLSTTQHLERPFEEVQEEAMRQELEKALKVLKGKIESNQYVSADLRNFQAVVDKLKQGEVVDGETVKVDTALIAAAEKEVESRVQELKAQRAKAAQEKARELHQNLHMYARRSHSRLG